MYKLIFTLMLALSGTLPAAHYDLYILAGQSNMDGRGDVSKLPNKLRKKSEHHIIFYRNPIGSSNGWKALEPGYSFAPKKEKTLPSSTFGPEIGFVQAMHKAKPTQKIALIKGSRGGTGIRRDWAPGELDKPETQKELYTMLLETVRLATKALEKEKHTYTLKGFLWHQGESDKKLSSQTYQKLLEVLIQRFREDLKSPELPFVVGEVFDNNGKRDKTRAAIQATAAASETVGLVSSEGTTAWDKTTHFDAESQLLLGERYADEIKKLLK